MKATPTRIGASDGQPDHDRSHGRLLVGHERLTDAQHERLLTLLGWRRPRRRHQHLPREGAPARRLQRAHGRGSAAAARRFYEHCDQTGVRECCRLARTIRAWEAEVLAFHTTGRSQDGTNPCNPGWPIRRSDGERRQGRTSVTWVPYSNGAGMRTHAGRTERGRHLSANGVTRSAVWLSLVGWS